MKIILDFIPVISIFSPILAHRGRRPATAEEAATRADRKALLASVKYVADDDEVPEDMDVFRFALARKIRTLLGDPKTCPEPGCRRTKRCVGPTMRCQRDHPAPKLTPEQDARMRAGLYRAVKQQIAEIDAAGGARDLVSGAGHLGSHRRGRKGSA
jgi:hypothetical protein